MAVTLRPSATVLAPLMAAAVVALLAGCAGVRPGPLELSAWEPPPGQSCAVGTDPAALTELMDSAALVAVVAGIGPPDGAVLASLHIDSAGNGSGRVIEATWADPMADRVAAAIVGALSDTVPGPVRFRSRLRVGDGRVEELVVGPGEHCRPAAANPDQIRDQLNELYRVLGRTGSVNVWLHVDSTGVVDEVQVRRSSGDAFLDQALARVASSAAFHPALLDRRPVAVWVALDLTLQPRPRP
jgi:TonB family protein